MVPSKVRLCIYVTAATFYLTGDFVMSQPRCDAARIAEEYIAKKYPFFDPNQMKLVISESENHWEVTYQLPENMLGGAPVIAIDKRTCAVVRAHLEQ